MSELLELPDGAPLPPPPADGWVTPHLTTSPARRPVRVATSAVLVGALIAGLAFDLVIRSRIGIGAATLPILVVGLLVATRSLPNRDARWLVSAAVLVTPWLAVRTNPTTVAIDLLVAWGLIVAAVSIGRSQRLLTMPGAAWLRAGVTLAESSVLVVPFVGRGVSGIIGRSDAATNRRAVGRGLLLALPGLIAVAALLASADAAFASLLRWWGVDRFGHVVVVIIGALLFAVLARCADEPTSAETVRPPRSLGRTEATTIVAAYVVVYATFVASRLLDVAPVATAQEISDAARAGFFQLVVVATITLGMLVWVRARAAMDGVLRMLITTAAGLTVAIVVIAVHRLAVYRSAYGLTELRLGTTWFSWWLALLFVLVAASTFVHLGRRRWATAVLVSALGWIVGWNVLNSDAFIARANVRRIPAALVIESAGRDIYDGELTVQLSDDAVPTIIEHFDEIPAEQQPMVRRWLCGESPFDAAGLGWNRATARAQSARTEFCGEEP